ncbi:MAG: hypothetical protein QGG64_14320 [Candidatus Latescibacteria bacterium]|jgi:hypothetical protein|nr:hypothetical protein [Candidatus Latescibacterota bacterium]
MLPGFLTTALEIIIILDICGAIAYFTITGLTRKNKQTEQALQPTPALAFEGLATQTVPARVSPTVYLPEAPKPKAEETSWTEGFKTRLTSFKKRLTYTPNNQNNQNGQTVKTRSLNDDYNRLGRVLDSFKEET